MPYSTRFGTLVLTAAVLGLAPPAMAQPRPAGPASTASAAALSPAEKADDLYRKARVHIAANEWPQAFELLWSAYQLKKSHDIVSNLGHAELRLGKYPAAATHLAQGLALLPANGQDDARKRIAELLTEAKKQVGTLKLTVTPPNALVNVGGQRIDPANIKSEVYVEAGEMRVEAGGLENYDGVARSVKVAKGQVVDVALVLTPRGQGVPTATGTGTPDTPGPNKAVVITGGAVAGASLIAGIATGVAGLMAARDADKKLEDIRATQGPCADPADTQACKDLASLRGQQSALTSAAFFTLMGAGVAGLGTVVYVLVARPGKPASAVGVAPGVSSSGGSLTIVGRW